MSVTYEVQDRIALITIDRPARRNAIDQATASALREAWRRFDDDNDAYVAILTGAGDNFSSGADLKSFDIVDSDDGPLGFTRTTVSKPTIAAIEGYCVAGGLEMALWCDLRVASSRAVFGCFERRFGVPLIDGGTQRLPRLIGHGLAMELILTGRAVDASEAHAIGLVNLVTEPGEALDEAVEWALRISQHPQPTLRADRMSLIEGSVLPLSQGLAIERANGRKVMDVARAGADRFATGEGRSGSAVRTLVGEDPVDSDTLPWNRVPPSQRPSPRHVQTDDPFIAPETDQSGSDFETETAETPAEAPTRELQLDIEDTFDAPSEAEAEFGGADVDEPEFESRAATPWAGREGNEVDLGFDRAGYFIAPVVERGRAVVVLSDMGDHLSDAVLDSADQLASLGHSALAIDLFGDGDDSSRLDPERVVRVVARAVDTLIAGGFASAGTVGLVGFGVGGGLALWIAGLEERVTSVVAFGPHSPWAEVGVGWRLSEAAYLCHQGSSDQPTGAPDAAKTEIELRDLGLDATFHVYPAESVSFYKPADEGYDEAMTDVAWQRTELFLDRHL